VKRRRKNSLTDLFRRHHGMSWKSAQLAKEYEKRHPGYKPPEGKAKPHRSTSRSSSSSERDQMRRDVVSALRNLGYPAKIAQQAERQAQGSDFDSRFRTAAGAATFISIKRGNPMRKRRKKKKNSRRRRSVRRVKVNRRRRNVRRRRHVIRHRARRRKNSRRRRSQKSYLRSLVRQMIGGRKRKKRNRRRVKRANPARPKILKVGTPAQAKTLARRLRAAGYRARYVKG